MNIKQEHEHWTRTWTLNKNMNNKNMKIEQEYDNCTTTCILNENMNIEQEH